MSNPVGKIYEVDGDRVRFLLRKDTSEPISFGEILKIMSTTRTFYIRVTNVQVKSMLDMKEIFYEVEGKEAIKPYSSMIPTEGAVFLQASGDKTRSPSFVPSYMDKVYRTNEKDHRLLRLSGDLILGGLRCGEEITSSVGINVEAFPLHMGMFGMTGSGKTNAELVLNALIMDNPNSVGVVFDFHGELLEGKRIGKGLCDHPNFHTKMRYYPPEKIKIGIKTIWTSHLPILFSQDDLSIHQFNLAKKQDRELGRHWISIVKDAIANGTKLPSLKGHPSVVTALLRRLDSLPDNIFLPNSDYSFLNDIVENVKRGISCVVELSGLTLADQKRVACLIAYTLAHEYEDQWKKNFDYWKKLPILLITLEEAHEFLDPKKRTFFSDLTLKYRKYNVGLNVVTPRPSRIDLDVFAELWTKLVMKTTLAKDRDFITKNTPYLEYSDIELKLLDKGEALLVSEPQLRFAVPIKITHYPDYLESLNDKNYDFPDSKSLTTMDSNLKAIKNAGKRLISS